VLWTASRGINRGSPRADVRVGDPPQPWEELTWVCRSIWLTTRAWQRRASRWWASGGAGGNAIRTMIESQVTDVEFVVANTDIQA
jgi:hypothetical protein